MNQFTKTAGSVLGAAILTEAAAALGFFHRIMRRGGVKLKRAMKLSGADWTRYASFRRDCQTAMAAYPRQEVHTKSFDGLTLRGTYFFPPETGEKKKVAICFHGYSDTGMNYYQGLSHYYLKRGVGMLIPDARAHGKSEGAYVGFGCLDRKDALSWVHWLLEREAGNVEIFLHGVSMGGTTALMAGGMDLPRQVKGIVSDSAFTSAKDIFSHVMRTVYHIPPVLILPALDLLAKRFAGYGLDECNALREVARAKVPILFIHGTKDAFVPAWMCDKLYQSCGSKKRKLFIEGAAHVESYYLATEEYEAALDQFLHNL